MAKKFQLFSSDIPPACACCEFGRPSPDQAMILCSHYGPVVPYYKCKKFVYDPLKRLPKKQPALPRVPAEEFDL